MHRGIPARQRSDLASGSQKVLTEAWDRSPDSLTFGAKGARLWVTADHFGQHSIFSIDVRSGKEKLVIKDGSNNFQATLSHQTAILRVTYDQVPAEATAIPGEIQC